MTTITGLVRSSNAVLPRYRTRSEILPKAERIEGIGVHMVRYSLALVFLWMGALKFAAYEAAAIQPMVAAHPLLSWLYDFFGVGTVSGMIGGVEIAAAVLIAVRPLSALAGAIGGALAIGTLAITSSFLVLLPPVWEGGSFPLLSVIPGQFLLKDLVLLAAAVWLFGNAAKEVRQN